jgi:quercetin dioxygenase-like cupin family protein
MTTTTPETITLGGVEIRFLVDADATDGAFTMFEFHVAGGARVPVPHSHDAFDETAYVLEGTMTFTVDGEVVERSAGEVVHIPRGAVHGFEALHGDTAALAVITPGLFRPTYFRELRDVLQAAAGGPPDVGALMEVMRRHGLTPAAR